MTTGPIQVHFKINDAVTYKMKRLGSRVNNVGAVFASLGCTLEQASQGLRELAGQINAGKSTTKQALENHTRAWKPSRGNS